MWDCGVGVEKLVDAVAAVRPHHTQSCPVVFGENIPLVPQMNRAKPLAPEISLFYVLNISSSARAKLNLENIWALCGQEIMSWRYDPPRQEELVCAMSQIK